MVDRTLSGQWEEIFAFCVPCVPPPRPSWAQFPFCTMKLHSPWVPLVLVPLGYTMATASIWDLGRRGGGELTCGDIGTLSLGVSVPCFNL